jgi:hypothetical protein|tara:strand:- start:7410 stop:7640 length:231 start_codon:yes stop_codon:yes gene_type:complete
MINLIEVTEVEKSAVLQLNDKSIRLIKTLKDAETRLNNPAGLDWQHIKIQEPSSSKIFDKFLQGIIDDARPKKRRQ